MPIVPQQAYRLGSMPRHVLRTFRRSKWPEMAPAVWPPETENDIQPVIRLLEEWQELLRGVRDKALLPDVKACREQIEAAVARVADQKRTVLHGRMAQFIRGIARAEPSKDAFSQERYAAVELLEGLVEKAERAGIQQKVPEGMRDLHRLGQLVAQCRASGKADDSETAEIWRIAIRWASEEDLTGRLKGAEAGTSIQRLVLARLEKIDELFSVGEIQFRATMECQQEGIDTDRDQEQVLTVDQVAQRLQVSVDTVDRLISTGQLKAAAFSGKGVAAGKKVIRITPRALEEFLSKNAPAVPSDQKRTHRQARRAPSKDYFT